MPELPEVETIRRALAAVLPGRLVERAHAGPLPLRAPWPRQALRLRIQGQRVESVGRRAKHLLLRFANHATLVIHLGMSGRLLLVGQGVPPGRHVHLRLQLDSGQELRLVDPRRFGSVQVLDGVVRTEAAAFAGLGPEPLDPDWGASALSSPARGRRGPVKSFLMDGRVVAGIGNIYASEILFAARLHPEQPVPTLPPAAWERLALAVRQVLARAVAAGGTTIADFVGADGQVGSFQNELAVYGRAGEPCPACGTPIASQRLAGRSTFFCPSCQRYPG
ncbi:MAG: bifunctional DNA-formamidopyrimidine glycosylase/DNA-(apurinic or apyrimidinic site) lyase [Thermodesulfobacteriota bacterium]